MDEHDLRRPHLIELTNDLSIFVVKYIFFSFFVVCICMFRVLALALSASLSPAEINFHW